MMTLFNVGVGIGFAILALIPFLFMRKKWHLLAILAITVGLGVVGYFASKNYIYPYYLGWEFERDIKKQPLFALIAKYHPKEFQQFIEKVKNSLSKKEGLDAIATYSTELTNEVFYQHLQTAPDDPIFLYLKSILELYRYLYAIDPRAVVKLENGDESIPVDLHSFWEDKAFQALLNQVLESKQKIIEGSLETPHEIPTEEITTPILNNILDELVGKYGKDVVRFVFTPSSVQIPPKLAAAVIIDFYSIIKEEGKEKAGIVMRHIANLKTNMVLKNKELLPSPTEIQPPVAAPSPPAVAPSPPVAAPSPPAAAPSQLPAAPQAAPKDMEIPTLPNEIGSPKMPNDVEKPSSKEISAPKIPSGVEIPKPSKEIDVPKVPKDAKIPQQVP